MRRFLITLIGWLAMIASVASAGTFPLTDGSKIVGSPDAIVDKGVIFLLDGGDYSPRIEWSRFTPEALKELMAEARTDAERSLLEPLVENLPQEVAKRKEIIIKPIQTPDRPLRGGGIFALGGSPVGWFIILVLYGANLFAAYEVSIYRRQPLAIVCGLAAIPFFGVLSPIIYGAMPTQQPPPESPNETILAQDGPAAALAAAAASEGATTAPPEAGSSHRPPPRRRGRNLSFFNGGSFRSTAAFLKRNSRAFSGSFPARRRRTWCSRSRPVGGSSWDAESSASRPTNSTCKCSRMRPPRMR